jgi:TRAP-type C4-dicarboxylate transport system permease small subunit
MESSGGTTRGQHRPVDLLIEVPAVVVTFVMMLHVTLNAMLRTFGGNPVPYTLETVQYWYLPIVAFLGFVAAQRRGQHIAADLIFERLPNQTRRFVLGAVLLACAVVSLGFAWFGMGEAVHAMDIEATAGVSDLIAWPVYFLVPLAFGSLTVQMTIAGTKAIFRGTQDLPGGDPGGDTLFQEATTERQA